MPRLPRVLIENACFHAMTRGNQKQKVFFDKTDYELYLNILRKAKLRYGVRLYSYCLMPNHVHLLVDPKVAYDVSWFMHWINRGYAAYFNKTYNKVGHVWQGRFASKPIIKDEYLLNCSEYIEANPVRAGLVSAVSDYQWSSYRERNQMSGRKRFIDEIAAR